MENLTITIDFSGVTPASGDRRIDILPPGLNAANIIEFKHFTDDGNVLYMYMDTQGMRHRERFNVDNEYAKALLMGVLVNLGVPESKLSGKSAIPFHKLVGKTVYFNYTPPATDESGARLKSSYCKYSFYSKDRYDQLAKYANIKTEDIEVEAAAAPENGAATPVNTSASSEEDFDFLLR